MKRLQEINRNTAQEYDRIFKERRQKGIHWFDIKRWKYLIRKFKGGWMLDMGCLDSLVPVFARKKYPNSVIWGIDIAEKAIESMQHSLPWVYYSVQNVYQTSFSNETFDYVVAGELVEHLETPQRFLKEAFRILKPGGILALSTPLEETEAGEFDKDRHLWSFTKEDVEEFLIPYGKVKIKTIGSNYIPYKYHPRVLVCFCTKYDK